MAEGAKIAAGAGASDRPLSPHLQIYRWPVTMAASIFHRATGIALYAGMVVFVWWVAAAASGPQAYETLTAAVEHPLGRLVLFGFVWSLAFHLLNGIRHLAWDIGYGFKVPTAKATATLVFVLSVVLAIGIFWLGYLMRDGVL